MEQTEKRELHQYGDRELWRAEAEDQSWSLPLFIEWRIDKAADVHYAHILPAVCLYYSQALTLNALFGPHDIQGKQEHWIIPRRIAEAILHKAPGITPLRYYKWPEPDCIPIEPRPALSTAMNGGVQKRNNPDPVRRSFIEWLSKERKISSSIINAVLHAVADGAPEWMLEHRQPLDLGFCRIIAVPFRANWKEIVEFKCRAIKFEGQSIRNLLDLPEPERTKALDEVGLPAILTSPHNVALKRGKKESDAARIDYTLEVIPSMAFESATNKIESKRMARGPSAYVGEFEEAVESLYSSIVMAFRTYLKKILTPHADVPKVGHQSIVRFLPIHGRKIKVRNKPISRLPVCIVPPPSQFSVLGQSDDPRLVSAQAAQVQAVPAVLQTVNDVRECIVEGDVEIRERDDGTNGVSLQHDTKSESKGQHMLAGGPNSGDGLGDTGDRT